MSVGTAFWVDEFKVRNLQLRADVVQDVTYKFYKKK